MENFFVSVRRNYLTEKLSAVEENQSITLHQKCYRRISKRKSRSQLQKGKVRQQITSNVTRAETTACYY